MYAAPERRAARADPRPSGPRREGRRAHRALARASRPALGLDRLAPAEYERFMATNAAYREKFGIPFVVCVREHTKDVDPGQRRRPAGQLASSRRSRPRSARSPRSPACGWRMRCEPLDARAGHGHAAGPRRAWRSSCAGDGAVLAVGRRPTRTAARPFGDVGGGRVRARVRGRRLLRRARRSWTASRSASGSPTPARTTTCRCSSRRGPTARTAAADAFTDPSRRAYVGHESRGE